MKRAIKALITRNRAIYNHFGYHTQLFKLQEECIELVHAIGDYREHASSDNLHAMMSEVADVLLVSLQFWLVSPLVRLICRQKLDRTEERVKSGFYEKTSHRF